MMPLWVTMLLVFQATTNIPSECIVFSSAGRLMPAESFTVPVMSGLEFRLRPNTPLSDLWTIMVGPTGEESKDFLWIVSPPLRTAPQLMIGNSYGYRAEESVQIERNLRFVLTEQDYQDALQIVETQLAGPEKMARLERLGQGVLTLKVTSYSLREGGRTPGERDGLNWIEFEGRACIGR